jgi:hypothetical protein
MLYEELPRHLDNVRSHGRYFSAHCPYHDDRSNSLLVYPDGFICLAAGCRERGSLEKLNRLVRGNQGSVAHNKPSGFNWRDLPLAALVERAHDLLTSYPEQQTYLAERGVANRILPNQLGWWKGWYTLPIRGQNGTLDGLVLRAGPARQADSGERFLCPPGQHPLLFVPDWPKFRAARKVFVAFGLFDALTLAALDLPVCAPTVVRILPELFEPIRKKLVLLPDKGEQEIARALAMRLGWRGSVGLLDYPHNCKDVNDYVSNGKTKLLTKQLARM